MVTCFKQGEGGGGGGGGGSLVLSKVRGWF